MKKKINNYSWLHPRVPSGAPLKKKKKKKKSQFYVEVLKPTTYQIKQT